MNKSEFTYLLDLYVRNQEKQLDRLSKIHSYILERCPDSDNLASIMSMTEPSTWKRNVLEELGIIKEEA